MEMYTRGRRGNGCMQAQGMAAVYNGHKMLVSRAAIDSVPLATGLLRTHVSGRPGVMWPLADILLPQRQPEIGYKRLATPVEQAIARLDVPMHQSLLVGWCNASATVAAGSTASCSDSRACFSRLARSVLSMYFETT